MALRYPLESLTYNYQGTISFTAFEEKLTDVSLADLENIINSVSSTVTGNLQRTYVRTGRDGVTDQAQLAQAKREADDLKSFKGDNYRVPTRSDMSDRIKNKSQPCILYLPPGLQFNDGVSYDNQVDLGTIGAVAEAGIRSGRSISASLLAGINKYMTSFAESLSGPLASDIARVGAVRTASKAGAAGEGVAVGATGVQINPNRRTILRSPNIRNFRFTFKLIPSSLQEAQEITKIIRFFRSELYPATIKQGGIAFGYKVPRKFDIRINYGEREIATKILPCFLQTVDVVYNPGSMSFHKGGEFTEIDLSLGFTEERSLSQEDITGFNKEVATEIIDAGDGVITKGTTYLKYVGGGY
jgi:hypothetical protein